jgi:hypothetical protein
MMSAKTQLSLFVWIAILAGCSTHGSPTIPTGPSIQPALTQRAPARCGKWSIVKSASKSQIDFLHAVGASSANNVWTVGQYAASSGNPSTLTERWNGSKWSVMSSPNVGHGANILEDVAVLSESDAWAVGISTPNSTSLPKLLIEHWDGQKWSVVNSPSPGRTSALSSVRAVSSSDVWAAGEYADQSASQGLIEHWNGKTWKVIPNSDPGSTNYGFGGLAIVSAKDIWAVGAQSSDGGYTYQTLTERWDGKSWSVVTSPNPGGYANGFGAATAIGANDVWAVGTYQNSSSFPTVHSLAEHWDGASWKVVTSPNEGSGANYIFSVAARASGDVWMVGYVFDPTHEQYRTLIEHWNGSQWRIVPSPNRSGTYFDELYGVTAVSNSLWAVGSYAFTSSLAGTLTEFYC